MEHHRVDRPEVRSGQHEGCLGVSGREPLEYRGDPPKPRGRDETGLLQRR